MKQVFLLLFLSAGFTTLCAQSLETGKKFHYYQRHSSAESFFHDHLKQQPDNAEAWLWLTKSYISQNELQKAADSLALAPASIHDDPYYLVAKGSVFLITKKTDSARLHFDKAINMTKGRNSAIAGSIAEIQTDLENGDISYAVEVIQKALKKDKNNAWLYVTMGNAWRKMHNATEAYKAYKNALEKDKNYAEAYYQLGKIFLSQKNADLYLEYFAQAVNADKNYAAAQYELYSHYLYTEPVKAMSYFQQYAGLSDKTIRHEYAYTDLLYLTKDYEKAISHAKKLISAEGDDAQARLYKLIAYSYGESKDTSNAIIYMQQYFGAGNDSIFIVKDFETMADLYVSQPGGEDSAIAYYQKAINILEDSASLYKYYEKLALLSKATEDYRAQAKWLGKYYMGNDKASNIDLFNWGLASYRAQDYPQADSVFALYTEKYPEQGFGFYWRARSNAAIDTALTEGLAVPHYQKLIDMLRNDTLTANNKKWMLEAYAYLAAYETNTQKDYKEAIDYFDKILEIDPENANAKKYVTILEKNLKDEETAK